MKKNLTELVFILDRSGSMAGLESDTIGGFNAMIAKQKKEPGEAFVSTVLFDNYSEVFHDRLKLSDVPAMTDKEYQVSGCTALLDAIGGAIISPIYTSMHALRMYLSILCSSSLQTVWRMQVVTTLSKKYAR